MRLTHSLIKSLYIVSTVGIAFISIIILFFIPIFSAGGTYKKTFLPVLVYGPASNRIDADKVTLTVKNAEPASNQVGLTGRQAGIESGIRLKIPVINVDSAVEYVGLTSVGAMDVPKNPLNAGWYELGPSPGGVGSAVIAGHVNWWKGAKGVFEKLSELKQGDKIEVLDEKGSVISFVVREIRTFDAAADATDVFSSNDGKVHLNLITCEGVWDKRTKQYTERLVVFADKE